MTALLLLLLLLVLVLVVVVVGRAAIARFASWPLLGCQNMSITRILLCFPYRATVVAMT